MKCPCLFEAILTSQMDIRKQPIQKKIRIKLTLIQTEAIIFSW